MTSLINGVYYSFSSIEIDIKGQKFRKVSEINYSETLEPGMARGTSAVALAHTQGDYEAEASFTMFRSEFDRLTALLGDGFGEVEFPITITYAAKGQPTVTDRLPAVRIKGVDGSNSQGSDPLAIKCDLVVLTPIERNGLRLVSRDA